MVLIRNRESGMNVALKPKLKNFVASQIKSGRYESVEDLFSAAITRLMQDDRELDFAPGQLQALVDEGEADIAQGNVITLAQARKHFRKRATNSTRRSNRKK
jgi:putative addiction module CopG family antidote